STIRRKKRGSSALFHLGRARDAGLGPQPRKRQIGSARRPWSFEVLMINITLPDGSVRKFDGPVTVGEVAAAIGPGLAKAALGGKVDDKLVDVSHRIERDARLAIVTDKDPEGLDLIRHSTAHLLAVAV